MKNPKTVDDKSYRRLTCRFCKHVYYTEEREITANEYKTKLKRYRKDHPRVGDKYGCRRVRCVDTEEVFDSLTIAGNSIGISRAAICSCCSGRRETAAGMRWEYYNEDEKEKEV